MNRMINTVTGKIPIDSLGSTLSHEHIICADPSMLAAFGSKWMDRDAVVEKAVRLLVEARTRYGLSTIVDGTPLDLGRDVGLMREVSEKSGVNIVCSTGMYHGEMPYIRGKKPEIFSRYFIDEYTDGIGDTGVRPAIIKCATDAAGITPINKILLETMAIVHVETGLPLYAHNSHKMKTPIDQLALFESLGVNPSKLIIGHCSDSTDADYLEEIANHGCYLGFDRIYPKRVSDQAATVCEMLRRGYEDQLLLSHDYGVFLDFGNTDEVHHMRSNDKDYTTIHGVLLPMLRELGATDAQIHKLTYENPQRMLG